MDETVSCCGEESPVLFKHPKVFDDSHILINGLNLEDLHKELLLHIKKTKNIPRTELKSFLEQVSKISPKNPRNKWVLKKLEGLLKYILKKRSDFQNCIVRGEIEIYGKSWRSSQSNVPSVCTSPARQNSEFSLRMLSNTNFITTENFNKMETADSYNPSQDLFSSCTQDIHNLAQENYQMLKDVAHRINDETQDYVFKIPCPVAKEKIEEVFKIHETVENDYNSIVSLALPISETELLETQTDEEDDLDFTKNYALNEVTAMETSTPRPENVNAFDIVYEPNQQLKEKFKKISCDRRNWLLELISDLQNLKVKENYWLQKKRNEGDSSLDQTSGSVELAPIHTEENYKVIKETCAKFKEKYENNKNVFDFLDDVYN